MIPELGMIIAASITGGLSFLIGYLMYRHQINRDRKTDAVELIKIKATADGNLFTMLTTQIKEFDQNLRQVREELRQAMDELEDEREKRRSLEYRVDALEAEKIRISLERDEFARERDGLQLRVKELEKLVLALTGEKQDD